MSPRDRCKRRSCAGLSPVYLTNSPAGTGVLSSATRSERFVVLIGRHEVGPAISTGVITVSAVVAAVRLGLAADQVSTHRLSCL